MQMNLEADKIQTLVKGGQESAVIWKNGETKQTIMPLHLNWNTRR